MLVSERIGQLFVESDAGRDRLEFTEYGAGAAWVVLVPAELMPRRMLQPLARVLAGEGFHVVTLDPLGHGRSDRPADPQAYSVTAFAEQVIALLDHMGAPQAVVGGGHQKVNPHFAAIPYEPGDRFLVCSDGLIDGVWERHISDALAACTDDPAATAAADQNRPVDALVFGQLRQIMKVPEINSSAPVVPRISA